MCFLHIAALLLPSAALAQSTDYDIGVALFQKAQYESAIPYLRKAVKSNPADPRGWKALGVAYAAMGDYASSEEPFGKACELDPRLSEACYYYGRALYALDRFEPSIEILQRALKFEPDAWKIHLGLAQASEALERAADAEKEFRAALALCRHCDPKPGNGYGLFLIRQGRAGEATHVLSEVSKKFPQSLETHVHLGRALLERGDFAGAVPYLEKALAIDPKMAQAHLLLAKCYVRLGRTAEAQPHFDAAAKYGEGGRAER